MHLFSILSILVGLSICALAQPIVQKKVGSRTTAPRGCLTVGKTGKFSTIGSSLKALGTSKKPACIFVESGTYAEQLTINYAGPLTLYGSTPDTSSYAKNTVTITHSSSRVTAGGLVESSTVTVTSNGFKMYNINVENGFREGEHSVPAVAFTADADRLSFYGCKFEGHQDTLYAKQGRQYYTRCHISGAVDYIFGDASLWLTRSVIASSGQGSITANGREDNSDRALYVIDRCVITAAPGSQDLTSQVYLGRPWRPHARVQLQNSRVANIINAEGWTTMAPKAVPHYTEYNNWGPGSDTRQRKYATKTADPMSAGTVLGKDFTKWVDLSY